MKKSYVKLFFFELSLLIILLINSFKFNIFKDYLLILLLIISLIIFKIILGFEKDRFRYKKDIIFEIIIYSLIFLVLYYLFGLMIGFNRVDNFFSLYGIFNFIIPIIIKTILIEYLRFVLIKKSEESKLWILSLIIFILFDITNIVYYVNTSSFYNILLFISLSLIPSIVSNIVAIYICKKVGYKANILWLLIIKLYGYIIPIVPNTGNFLQSLVLLFFPLGVYLVVNNFFKKENIIHEEIIINDHISILDYVGILIILIFIYFLSDKFSYQILSIASGSMEPLISRGDAVVVYKKYDELNKGDIIVYQYENNLIVHRIINMISINNEIYIYTKGDNNNFEDNVVVTKDMVKGVVKFKASKIGYPTLWINGI